MYRIEYLPVAADFSETSLEQAFITHASRRVAGKLVPPSKAVAIVGDEGVSKVWIELLLLERRRGLLFEKLGYDSIIRLKDIKFILLPKELLSDGLWGISFEDMSWIISGLGCCSRPD